MTQKTKQRIKVLWYDTRIFSPQSSVVDISVMETVGFLEKETKNHYIIQKPVTINISKNLKHPEKDPSFYLIPKGMVEKIEFL